jgi:hypothetical protein
VRAEWEHKIIPSLGWGEFDDGPWLIPLTWPANRCAPPSRRLSPHVRHRGRHRPVHVAAKIRHHGSITLADHDGPGTTFVVTLPVKPSA